MVRVDDRLLHGQIICAWVPHIKADALVVASDEAAGDDLVSEIISSCAHNGLKVVVEGIEEAAKDVNSGTYEASRVIIILGDLKDALRLYEQGMRFSSLNIGNIHHQDQGSRRLSPSVIVNDEDDEIIERLTSLGVDIDIRDVPGGSSVKYNSRRRETR